jgi:hypothetical protein
VPDTSASRSALRSGRQFHREVMGGLSAAELKLEAAGGFLRGENVHLSRPWGDPSWFREAAEGIEVALAACGRLENALLLAAAEVAKLRQGQPAERPAPIETGTLCRDNGDQR